MTTAGRSLYDDAAPAWASREIAVHVAADRAEKRARDVRERAQRASMDGRGEDPARPSAHGAAYDAVVLRSVLLTEAAKAGTQATHDATGLLEAAVDRLERLLPQVETKGGKR